LTTRVLPTRRCQGSPEWAAADYVGAAGGGPQPVPVLGRRLHQKSFSAKGEPAQDQAGGALLPVS